MKKIILTLIIIVFSFLILMQSNFGSEILTYYIESQLEKSFYGKVYIKKVEFNFFQDYINIVNLRLFTKSGINVFDIPSLTIRYSIKSFYPIKIELDKIEAIQPHVYFSEKLKILKQSKNANQSTNVNQTSVISMNAIKILNGQFRYKDFNLRQINVDLNFPNNFEEVPWGALAVTGLYQNHAMNLQLNLKENSKFNLIANIEKINIQMQGYINRTATIGSIVGIIQDENQKLIDINSKLNWPKFNVNIIAKQVSTDGLLQSLTDEIILKDSKLNANLNFSGSQNQLTHRGYLNLVAKSLYLKANQIEYSNLNLNLKGNKNAIAIENLSLHSKNANFKAQGSIDLLKQLILQFEFQNLNVFDDTNVQVRVTGNGDFKVLKETAKFTGRVNLSDGEARLVDGSHAENLESLGDLEDVVFEKTVSSESEFDFLKKLSGNIDIIAPGHFWVKNNNTSIELAAYLNTGIKDDGNGFLKGTIQSQRGYTEVLGKRFNIVKGELHFFGDLTNPQIFATGEYLASPKDIYVDLTGSLKNIKPRFYSKPEGYTEEESLGVLLTGSSDFQGERSSQGRGPAATGLAAGFLIGKIKDKLGSKLPFDFFTADISTDTTSDKGSKVELGKYVSKNLFLKVGRDFGSAFSDPYTKLSLDYQISKKWSLLTTETDQGKSDFELVWRHEY